MIIKSAQFIKGIIGTDPILQEKFSQIAFVGRSNVGKSSMINSLLGLRNLVKSSSTPGRTKEINFFWINESFYFVDLPGYGYAKISANQAEKMRKMIIWYLQYAAANIGKIVLIIDANVGPKKFDLEMRDLLEEYKHVYLVVANKADKLTQKDAARMSQEMAEKFPNREVFFYSSKTSRKKDELLKKILEDQV